MAMPNYVTVIVSLAVVAIFFITASVLSLAVQPLRLRMAEIGENFLAEQDVPKEFKDHVRFTLDHAMDMRWPLLFAIFAIPVMALIYVFRLRWLSTFSLDEKRISISLREDFREICGLHNKITLANHPFLFPMVLLELVIIMLPAIILRTVIKGAFTSGADAKTVFLVIERYSKLRLFRNNHAI